MELLSFGEGARWTRPKHERVACHPQNRARAVHAATARPLKQRASSRRAGIRPVFERKNLPGTARNCKAEERILAIPGASCTTILCVLGRIVERSSPRADVRPRRGAACDRAALRCAVAALRCAVAVLDVRSRGARTWVAPRFGPSLGAVQRASRIATETCAARGVHEAGAERCHARERLRSRSSCTTS
jgi:hypothetical protein